MLLTLCIFVFTVLQVYAFWNQGGRQNVEAVFKLIVKTFRTRDDLSPGSTEPESSPLGAGEQLAADDSDSELSVTPDIGLLHPLYEGGEAYFESPKQYMDWYMSAHPGVSEDTPRVGLLLYRKHVITRQVRSHQSMHTISNRF
jgi:magnesium chelatase subunit H